MHQHTRIASGIYGWKKRCLYALVLALLAIVIINLALTLWIFQTMEFNVIKHFDEEVQESDDRTQQDIGFSCTRKNGIGELRIVPGGVRLSGKAYVLGSMFSSDIRSHPQKAITFQDKHNVIINTRDDDGNTTNSLYIGNDKILTNASQFIINSLEGEVLFSVNKDEVVIGSERLRVTGIADFKGSVQTSVVQGCEGSELNLESLSRTLDMSAAGRIWIHTRKDLSTSSLNDIIMETMNGEIHLKTPNLYLTKLKVIDGETLGVSYLKPSLPNRTSTTGSQRKIFQVCACQNGKIFIALQDGVCALENNSKECL